jgi:hypothetical protein
MNQSVGGIWTAENSPNLGAYLYVYATARAIVTEDGDFYIFGVDASGCANLAFGNISVGGSQITGSAVWGITPWTTPLTGGQPLPCVLDGVIYGPGGVSGTVVQRSSLTMSESEYTPDDKTSVGSEDATWTYDSLYTEPSSFATIAGNYTDSGRTLTIDLNGVLTEQEGNGCVLSGQVSVPNPSFNAYTFSLTYTGCGTPADGVAVTGVGTLDTTQTPNVLVFGVQFTADGAISVTPYELPKQQ